MKQKSTIDLIEDDYFTSGDWHLKIEQTSIALLGWLFVFLPFFGLALPLWQPHFASLLPFNYNTAILRPLEFLAKFFDDYFVFISITYLTLTFLNNYRFAASWRDHLVVDQDRQQERSQLVEQAWQEKFGNSDERHNCSFYCVEPQQNLETDFAQTLFAKGEKNL